jgi:hypothetical protein
VVRSAKLGADKKSVILEIELEDPTPSKSGRTHIVASTHGVSDIGGIKIGGLPLRGNVSLWVKPTGGNDAGE